MGKDIHMGGIDKVQEGLDELQESTTQNVLNHGKDPREGEMPPRHKAHSDKIGELIGELRDVTKAIMDKQDLIKRLSKLKEEWKC